MSNPILVTFWQFSASLTEWLDQAVIDTYQSEAFTLYSSGHSLEQVANAITHINAAQK